MPSLVAVNVLIPASSNHIHWDNERHLAKIRAAPLPAMAGSKSGWADTVEQRKGTLPHGLFAHPRPSTDRHTTVYFHSSDLSKFSDESIAALQKGDGSISEVVPAACVGKSSMPATGCILGAAYYSYTPEILGSVETSPSLRARGGKTNMAMLAMLAFGVLHGPETATVNKTWDYEFNKAIAIPWGYEKE